ncbi:hypothetical protein GCM10028781_26480 [Nostocoides australiense]
MSSVLPGAGSAIRAVVKVRDLEVEIPGVGEVANSFTSPTEPIALALAQEKEVTTHVEALFRAARAEGDVLGEQFIMWFLKEQVEEVSSMSTLLTIATRAGDVWFQIEEHLAREAIGGGADPAAPPAAGGAL